MVVLIGGGAFAVCSNEGREEVEVLGRRDGGW